MKVDIHEDSPAQAIVKRASTPVEVTDPLGRKLKVKPIRSLDRYDLARVLGPEGAANPSAMGPAAIAFSVIEIDGEIVATPKTEREIRALIQRLDDEGLEAAAQAHIDHFSVGGEAQVGEPLRSTD
jgi:hypothetical protein